MARTHGLRSATLFLFLIAGLAGSALANSKIQVCHMPPGPTAARYPISPVLPLNGGYGCVRLRTPGPLTIIAFQGRS